jgi:hypothetical protein
MPRLPNKEVIDDIHFGADAFVMHQAFAAGKKIDAELIDLGETLKPGSGGIIGNELLKKDAHLHLPEQESICNDLHKFMAGISERQWKLVETRRKWLDGELDGLTLPPPKAP